MKILLLENLMHNSMPDLKPQCLSSSSRYIGEGMAASMTGLAVGLVLLSLRETNILSAELAQALLTFNHTNFFV